MHQSEALYRVIIGGNQSGKTITLAAEIYYWAKGTHPYIKHANRKPNHIYVIAPEYRLLYEGVYRHLRPDGKSYNGMGFFDWKEISRWGPKHPQTDLPSFIEIQREDGVSRIDFITVDGGEQGRKKVQAAAVDLIAIDEEIDDIVFDELKMRTLAVEGRIIMSMTAVKSEPYLLELEDRWIEGDKQVFLTKLSTLHNRYLSIAQREEVFRGMDEDKLSIRLAGNTRRDQNLIYPMFSKEHICQPFPIPKEWPKWCFLDPGFNVFAGLWIAYDPAHELYYGYREMYLKKSKLEDVANFIFDSEKLYRHNGQPMNDDSEIIGERFIDPNAKAHMQNGEAGILAQLSGLYGIHCIPAFNSIEAGIEAAKKYFEISPLYHKPRFQVFNTCKEFIKEIRKYKIKFMNVAKSTWVNQDKPIKKDDHLMDCFKYFALRDIANLYKQEERKEEYGRRDRNVTKKIIHPMLGSEF